MSSVSLIGKLTSLMIALELASLLKTILQLKEIRTIWTCGDLHTQKSLDCVCCESCLCWYHYKCVGLVTKPKMKNWYCRQCYLAKL